MSKSYKVKELCLTVQGEGFFAGTPAIMLRLGGCNLWSGKESTRDRDAERNDARCPLFCDTDFVGGEKMSLDLICSKIGEVTREVKQVPGLCFVTGGEPMLQADQELVDGLSEIFDVVAFETNGTRDLPFEPTRKTWITVSPKTPRDSLRSSFLWANEIKVVVPNYNPEEFMPDSAFIRSRVHLWVQPCDGEDNSTEHALDYVYRNPGWRLSVQTHKMIGVD